MKTQMSNFRWVICVMLFLATTINYMDRQVLSLTWKDFIAPEFNWTDSNYGTIAGCFSFVYSLAMLFSGRFIDFIGTKKGYVWAIGVWSFGACLHAFCGIITSGIVTGKWIFDFELSKNALSTVQVIGGTLWSVSTISISLFLLSRCILAIGESGNFPCAIKVVSIYFPQKDRSFVTSLFNSGAQIGAMLAPFSIPVIAKYWGWEMSFLIIGILGFLWLGIWVFIYDLPENNVRVNKDELDYIKQDLLVINDNLRVETYKPDKLYKYFKDSRTWIVIASRFLPEGVWWFFLFWTPAYIKDVYGYSSDSWMGMILIFVLYLITTLSILGGYLPTFLVNKYSYKPFDSRIISMFVFSLFPLLGLFAPYWGKFSCWFPIVLIGIIGAAHQSWSANAYSLIGDIFPKNVVATITGIGGMLGGIGSFLFNQCSGLLFTFSKENNLCFMGFDGIQAGYMIVFIVSSVSYLLSWCVIKWLISNSKNVSLN